jgi:hypothetical protein
MGIQSLTRSIRLCIRSEAMVAEIRLLIYARKVMLASIAFLAGLIGFAFFNLALFEYLQSLWGPIGAPLAIGLVNLVCAAGFLLWAKMVKPGPELALAEDLRNLAGSELESQFQSQPEGNGILNTLSGTSSASVVRLLVPTVISIITAMQRSKQAK